MIRQRGTKLIPLTRDVAADFATMERWDGERDLMQQRVRELLEKIDSGRFHSPEWAVAYLSGRRYRMNGQHSSTALSECKVFPLNLLVKVDEFDVDCTEDLGRLFSDFDTGGRTARQIIGTLTSTLRDIPGRQRISIASAMYYAMSGFSPSSGERRGMAIHSDPEFARWAASTLTAKHLARVPVYSAAFLMWRANKEAAAEFWTMVAGEQHPAPFHPTRTVARELRDHRSHRSSQSKAMEVCSRCINGWNAWRAGREVKYTKYYGDGIPECAR